MRVSLIWLSVALSLVALPVAAVETYDLIFKTGTLSDVPADAVLRYRRDVTIAADPDRADRNTGAVQLTQDADDMARLTFLRDAERRNLGQFPATVGNPIVMYFIETVLRDVAHQAGGSPFYIRNRIKESLVQFAEIEQAAVPFGDQDVSAQQITLRPFLNDKNRDKMKGYGDLTLTFTMSDQVPGWYAALVANVPGTAASAPIYNNALVLQPVGVAQ